MAALTLASYALPRDAWSGLLQASSKAGFVGGIADWFAVTALFRHPLGLPIPHTAIIPAQKERLGRALGRFVAEHVFTDADVARTLGRIDLPGLLARALEDRAGMAPALRALAALLPGLLGTVQDGRARRLVSRLLPRLLGGSRAGFVVARALRALVAGGRHQEMLGFILEQLRQTIAAKEGQLRLLIEERVREQGGRLVGWAIGASIATRVLTAIQAELDRVNPDDSELRAAFDAWMLAEIDRMEADPERAAEIGRAVRRVLGHETVQLWLWDVWARLRVVVEADAARPDGHVAALLAAAASRLAELLRSDPGTRARVQATAETVAYGMLPAAQARLSGFIAEVVARWDARTITDRLELRVGRDLQFVRINGTLVGFLVGGLAYFALAAVFGWTAP